MAHHTPHFPCSTVQLSLPSSFVSEFGPPSATRCMAFSHSSCRYSLHATKHIQSAQLPVLMSVSHKPRHPEYYPDAQYVACRCFTASSVTAILELVAWNETATSQAPNLFIIIPDVEDFQAASFHTSSTCVHAHCSQTSSAHARSPPVGTNAPVVDDQDTVELHVELVETRWKLWKRSRGKSPARSPQCLHPLQNFVSTLLSQGSVYSTKSHTFPFLRSTNLTLIHFRIINYTFGSMVMETF
jgi:hypothetical protein